MPSKTLYTLLASMFASAFVAASISALVMFHIFDKHAPEIKTLEDGESAVLRHQLYGTNFAREYCYEDACTVHFQKGNGPECVGTLFNTRSHFTSVVCNWKQE